MLPPFLMFLSRSTSSPVFLSTRMYLYDAAKRFFQLGIARLLEYVVLDLYGGGP